MTGLNQYSKVTKKLFKGMQYQIMSILKFGLYHFKRQHFMAYQEQLRRKFPFYLNKVIKISFYRRTTKSEKYATRINFSFD